MNYEKLCEYSMNIIVNAGMAKSSGIEAIKLAENGFFEEAKLKLQDLDKYLIIAHDIQTELITIEAKENKNFDVNLLLIHSQDHLTMAQIIKDMAVIIINLYRKVSD